MVATLPVGGPVVRRVFRVYCWWHLPDWHSGARPLSASGAMAGDQPGRAAFCSLALAAPFRVTVQAVSDSSDSTESARRAGPGPQLALEAGHRDRRRPAVLPVGWAQVAGPPGARGATRRTGRRASAAAALHWRNLKRRRRPRPAPPRNGLSRLSICG